MSNRRRPARAIPLDGTAADVATPLPYPLGVMVWSDTPTADYRLEVLNHLARAVQAGEVGRLNAWVCEACDTPFVARDLHPGTTPMTVGHITWDPDTDCRGTTLSNFYAGGRVRAIMRGLHGGRDQVEMTHEWYRPSAVELAGLERGARDHVAQGGLLVRPVPQPKAFAEGRTSVKYLREVADITRPTVAEVTDPANAVELGRS